MSKKKRVKCFHCKGTGYIAISTVQARRMELGLTQEQVAAASGYNRPAYAMIESGSTKITSDKLRPLAKTLQVTVDELLEMSLGE